MRTILLGLTIVLAARAENPVSRWIAGREASILREFTDFLAIPNVAAAPPGLVRNASWIQHSLERRGVRTRLLEIPGGPPVVYGERDTPGAGRTITFYAHYDGQPVDAREWKSPPFQPVLTDGRLYARSASDDKAAIQAMLTALDAIEQLRMPVKVNLRFFFEGEEEAGSPHLRELVRKHAGLLKTGVWLICDGPVHSNRQQQVYFGARGIAGASLTVYGPIRELHSGHYGNWAPNPAMMLARLLSSMKNDDGLVLIEDFYKGAEPLGQDEQAAIEAFPPGDDALRAELGLVRTEGSGRSLIRLTHQPSLNIRGMESGHAGEQARNVIPAFATASLDIRLVKGIAPEVALDRLTAHIRKQGYFVTAAEPDMDMRRTHPRIARLALEAGYPAARTSMDLPVSRDVVKALESVHGRVLRLPSLGGSVPLYIFTDDLGTPAIGIPIANHDNNQHSFNENIRLQNLWDGVETMVALMTRM